MPNVQKLEKQLTKFCRVRKRNRALGSAPWLTPTGGRAGAQVAEADEVVLFEKASFLVIAHAVLKPHK